VSLETPSGKSNRFFFEWNLNDIGVAQGDVLEYWFEVWDNDLINGPKMTRSTSYTFAPPSEEEIRAERDEANQDIASRMSAAREEAEALRKEMEEVQRQLGEDDEFDWKDERALDELVKRQESLKNALEELQKANQEKDKRANEFSPEEEQLIEQVMNEELRAMYDEMQKLMDQMNPEMMEEMQEQLESMEVDQESLEKELDRALEQFKQLEYEVNMQEAIDDLKALAEKQEELADQTKDQTSPNDSLAAQQDSLNQAFEELQERLDELDQANEELENPNPTMERSDENESIEEKMDDSSDQIKQDKNKKASQNQKDAAEEMKQMAEQMETMMQQAEEESMEEDMEALRALLENIIQLSFDEEDIMASLGQINEDDPLYITNGQTQRKLKDDAQMVEDSLFALSLRIPQLAPAVNREIGLINLHMEKALSGFGDRETGEITANQQYVMTSFNNLALMLDDALQQMQQSMSESKPGTGNCEKPGGNGKPKPSPSAGDMKKMQQSLGEKLEKMKEAMGKGANAGSSGKDQRQLSKELAQMAAQQAALRQMADKKAQELNADGSGDGKQMGDIAKEMEELERDLVNRDVSIETIERQQELMVRLLEAENAEMTRGEDNKRKSKVGKQNLAEQPPALEEYLKQKSQEVEWLRTIPLELDPYYRDRVNDYFNNLDLKKTDY
jgi:chromosome segregation ATPase